MKISARHQGFTMLETVLVIGIIGVLAVVTTNLLQSHERILSAREAERDYHVRQLSTAMSNHIFSTKSSRDFDALPSGESSRKPICRQGQTHADCVNLDILVTADQLSELPYDATEECQYFSGYEAYWGTGNRPMASAVHKGKIPGEAPGSVGCSPSCGNGACSGGETCSSCPSDCGSCNPVEYTIDSTADSSVSQQQRSPSVVMTNSTTGYVFYTDQSDRCVYSKTSDGGSTWGSAVLVSPQTDCLGIVVWYDQWTPGDTTGNLIHTLIADTGNDDLWYNRLDTTSDTFLPGGEVRSSSSPGSNQGGSLGNDNRFSITKATDGSLYIGTADGSDSFVLTCAVNCSSASNWTEVGTSPMPADDEHDLRLMPLASGNILLIFWNIRSTSHTVSSKIWNGSEWSTNWTTIGSAIDDGGYLSAWGATVNKGNNHIYLIWNNDVNDSDGECSTSIYNGSNWTAKSTLSVDDQGYGCDIAIDESTGVIYAIRVDRTDGSNSDILMNWSTDNMSSWSADTKMNVMTDNLVSVSMNMMSNFRLFATWFNSDTNDVIGTSVIAH